MAVKKKPKSVSVTPTSTYRVPAASTVKSKSKATGGVTVSHSQTLRHDLRPSSYAGIASPPTSVAEKAAAKDYNIGRDTGVQKGAEEFSKAQETFFRIAGKADVQNRINRGELPQSIDPKLAAIQEPIPNQASFDEQNKGQGTGFLPNADVGAERRLGTFGSESKTEATLKIAGIAAAAIFGGYIVVPWLASKLATSGTGTTAVSNAATVGTRGIVKGATGVASKWPINSAVKNLATSWYNKLLTSTSTVTTTNAAGKASTAVIQSTTHLTAGKLLLSLAITELGTVPWAAHLHSDNVIGSLSILARDARKAGDEQGVQEAEAALYEASNPGVWEHFLRFVPGINIVKESVEIANAAKLTLESLDRQNKMLADALENPEETYDEARARRNAEDEERDRLKREFQEAYYRDIEEQKAKAKAEERKADEEYYDKVLGREKKADGTERFFK